MECPKCGNDMIVRNDSRELVCLNCGCTIKPKDKARGNGKTPPPSAPRPSEAELASQRKELAIVSLVLSLLALVVCWMKFGSFFGIIFAVMALSFGSISICRIMRGEAGGKQQTIAALIIGALAGLLSVLVTVSTLMGIAGTIGQISNTVDVIQQTAEKAQQILPPSVIDTATTDVVPQDESNTNAPQTQTPAPQQSQGGGSDIADKIIDNIVGEGTEPIIQDALQSDEAKQYVEDAKKDINNTVNDLQNMYEESGVSPDATTEENISGLQKLLNDFLSWLPFSSNGKTLL